MPDLTRLAAMAGAAWGGFATAPVLVAERENAVFRTMLADRTPVALRLHRPGYHNAAAIAGEMAICEALADAGMACPWPYRTTTGGFVARIGDDCCRATLVQWIDGTPLSAVSMQDWAVPERFHAIGALLADFHLTADAVLAELPQRAGWSAERLTGGACAWGDPLAIPGLASDARALFAEGRALGRAVLARAGPRAQGLIHGDALPDNMLRSAGTLYLIDFDDCGPGYRLYDLATALITLAGTPDLPPAAAAVQAGYLDAGGPLPPEDFAALPVFLMLRAQASAAWAHDRCVPGDPRRDAYLRRAVALTRAALDGVIRGGST